jgi:hypothetical protein
MYFPFEQSHIKHYYFDVFHIPLAKKLIHTGKKCCAHKQNLGIQCAQIVVSTKQKEGWYFLKIIVL